MKGIIKFDRSRKQQIGASDGLLKDRSIKSRKQTIGAAHGLLKDRSIKSRKQTIGAADADERSEEQGLRTHRSFSLADLHLDRLVLVDQGPDVLGQETALSPFGNAQQLVARFYCDPQFPPQQPQWSVRQLLNFRRGHGLT